MLITQLLQRLRQQVSGMRLIEGASQLADAMQGPRAVPALYLVPLHEQAQELPHYGSATDQQITTTFGVLYALDAGRSAAGEDALQALGAVRQQVRRALVGWVPDAHSGEPVIFLGGELLGAPYDARLWWADDFQLHSYYRSDT